tara:strand:- start:162 stop:440 length:279 start_codon:yes stop_codon:yes gene_type:complete
MTEETHVSQTIGQRVKELRTKIDKLDGFDLAALPLIYLYELGNKSWKFAVAKGAVEWVKNKFNGKVTTNTTDEVTVKEVAQPVQTEQQNDVQ